MYGIAHGNHQKIISGGTTAGENCDHGLTGSYGGCREGHIAPDWLLIYEIAEETSILYLMRTGSHSDLF